MITGRQNALEIVRGDGRDVARRYAVFARVEHGSEVAHEAHSEEPVEELTLPLTRAQAAEWTLEHFEDLLPGRRGELLALLTRPTGALGRRTTDPLA